jgi:hypothetical protein
VGAAHSLLALPRPAAQELAALYLTVLAAMVAGSADPGAPAQEDDDDQLAAAAAASCPSTWDALALRQYQQQQQLRLSGSLSAPSHLERARPSPFPSAGCLTVLHVAVAGGGGGSGLASDSDGDGDGNSDGEDGFPLPSGTVLVPWAGPGAVGVAEAQQHQQHQQGAYGPAPLGALTALLEGQGAARRAGLCRELWHLQLQGLRADLQYLLLCAPGLFCASRRATWDARMYIHVLAEVASYLARQSLWELLAALLRHLGRNGLQLRQGNCRGLGRRDVGAAQLQSVFAEATEQQRRLAGRREEPWAATPPGGGGGGSGSCGGGGGGGGGISATLQAPSPPAEGFWSEAEEEAEEAEEPHAAYAAWRLLRAAPPRGAGPAPAPLGARALAERRCSEPGRRPTRLGARSASFGAPRPPLAPHAAGACDPGAWDGPWGGVGAGRGYRGAVSAAAGAHRRRSSGYRCASLFPSCSRR